MSNHGHKRRRSPSRTNKRETNYSRRNDSYHYPSGSINEIISRTDNYPPIVQSVVRELLLEQGKHKLTEERLNRCEREYVSLRDQYEQVVNRLAALQRDYDQRRLDFKPNYIESNHSNDQYRSHINQRLNNDRSMYLNEEMFYPKRQRRH